MSEQTRLFDKQPWWIERLARNLVAGEAELVRVWTKIEQIRAKQAAKPRYGPLPVLDGAEGGAGKGKEG